MRCEHTQTDKAPIMMYNVIHYNAIYCHADAVAEYDDDVDGDIEITMRCDAMQRTTTHHCQQQYEMEQKKTERIIKANISKCIASQKHIMAINCTVCTYNICKVISERKNLKKM